MLDFYTSHICKFNVHTSTSNAHIPCAYAQNVFYQMELRESEHHLEGELGVMYYKKPGVDERWRKLADIAAKVSYNLCIHVLFQSNVY